MNVEVVWLVGEDSATALKPPKKTSHDPIQEVRENGVPKGSPHLLVNPTLGFCKGV